VSKNAVSQKEGARNSLYSPGDIDGLSGLTRAKGFTIGAAKVKRQAGDGRRRKGKVNLENAGVNCCP